LQLKVQKLNLAWKKILNSQIINAKILAMPKVFNKGGRIVPSSGILQREKHHFIYNKKKGYFYHKRNVALKSTFSSISSKRVQKLFLLVRNIGFKVEFTALQLFSRFIIKNPSNAYC